MPLLRCRLSNFGNRTAFDNGIRRLDILTNGEKLHKKTSQIGLHRRTWSHTLPAIGNPLTASWQELIPALWTKLPGTGGTRLSGIDVHDTRMGSPCAPSEEEPDMPHRNAGLADATMTLDREEQPGSFDGRQTQANTLSQFDGRDDSDDLIREAGLCLIEMELTEPYDDTVDFFSWRANGTSASKEQD
jgi:hypothetical protein